MKVTKVADEILDTVKTLGAVLASAEHPVRNVRCDEKNPLNVSYRHLNTVGDWIVKATGGWPDHIFGK